MGATKYAVDVGRGRCCCHDALEGIADGRVAFEIEDDAADVAFVGDVVGGDLQHHAPADVSCRGYSLVGVARQGDGRSTGTPPCAR